MSAGAGPKHERRRSYVRALAYDLAETRASLVELDFEIAIMQAAGESADWRVDVARAKQARIEWLEGELERNGAGTGPSLPAGPATPPPPDPRIERHLRDGVDVTRRS